MAPKLPPKLKPANEDSAGSPGTPPKSPKAKARAPSSTSSAAPSAPKPKDGTSSSPTLAPPGNLTPREPNKEKTQSEIVGGNLPVNKDGTSSSPTLSPPGNLTPREKSKEKAQPEIVGGNQSANKEPSKVAASGAAPKLMKVDATLKAATKIQAAHRGHMTRKSLSIESNSKLIEEDDRPTTASIATKSTPLSAFRAVSKDDVDKDTGSKEGASKDEDEKEKTEKQSEDQKEGNEALAQKTGQSADAKAEVTRTQSEAARAQSDQPAVVPRAQTSPPASGERNDVAPTDEAAHGESPPTSGESGDAVNTILSMEPVKAVHVAAQLKHFQNEATSFGGPVERQVDIPHNKDDEQAVTGLQSDESVNEDDVAARSQEQEDESQQETLEKTDKSKDENNEDYEFQVEKGEVMPKEGSPNISEDIVDKEETAQEKIAKEVKEKLQVAEDAGRAIARLIDMTKATETFKEQKPEKLLQTISEQQEKMLQEALNLLSSLSDPEAVLAARPRGDRHRKKESMGTQTMLTGSSELPITCQKCRMCGESLTTKAKRTAEAVYHTFSNRVSAPETVQAEPAQWQPPTEGEACGNCANIFMPDELFCRRCGTKNEDQEEKENEEAAEAERQRKELEERLEDPQEGYGPRALLAAAERGDKQRCQQILELESYPAVNARDSQGNTALIWAAYNEMPEICMKILARKEFDRINACDGQGNTALSWAAYKSLGKVSLAILERGDFTQINKKDEDGNTALHWAAERGFADVCHAMLNRADFTELNTRDKIYGRTALILAAYRGLSQVCHAILTRRDLTEDGINAIDVVGNTAMTFAAMRGLGTVCSALLRHPYFFVHDAQDTYFKRNAAQWAAHKGHHDLAKILEEHSSNMVTRRHDGTGRRRDSIPQRSLIKA